MQASSKPVQAGSKPDDRLQIDDRLETRKTGYLPVRQAPFPLDDRIVPSIVVGSGRIASEERRRRL